MFDFPGTNELGKVQNKNPELKVTDINSLSEDDKYAYEYYRKNHLKWLNPGGVGKMIAPYAAAGSSENIDISSLSRPHRDQPIMLLKSNALRDIVLHEFVHFLINEKRLNKFVDYPEIGKLNNLSSLRTGVKPANVKFEKMLEIREALLIQKKGKKLSAAEYSSIVTLPYWAALKLLNTQLDYFLGTHGEEIGVCLFLILNQEHMVLSESGLNIHRNYLFHEVQSLGEELLSLSTSSILKELHANFKIDSSNWNLELKNKMKAFFDRVDAVNSKLSDVTDWYNKNH